MLRRTVDELMMSLPLSPISQLSLSSFLSHTHFSIMIVGGARNGVGVVSVGRRGWFVVGVVGRWVELVCRTSSDCLCC